MFIKSIVFRNGALFTPIADGSNMRTYIRKWPHIRWLLTASNGGTNSIFKALRDNTDGAQDMFLSELVRIMEKYPWCNGIDIDLEKAMTIPRMKRPQRCLRISKRL